MSQFPMSSGFDRPQGGHDNLLNSQSLGLDVSTFIQKFVAYLIDL